MTTSTIDLPESIENVMKIASCDRTLTLYYRRITFLQNTCNNNVSVKMCLFSAITYDTVLQVSVRAPLCTQQSLRIKSGYCIFFTQIRMFLFVTFAQCCCQKNNFNKRCSLKFRNVNIQLNFCFVPRGS